MQVSYHSDRVTTAGTVHRSCCEEPEEAQLDRAHVEQSSSLTGRQSLHTLALGSASMLCSDNESVPRPSERHT